MIFPQFGDDFVLAPELVTQGGDGSLEVGIRRGVVALEGAGAVLEERLLPDVEGGGRELILIAEIRDGHAVDQMAPKDGDLLDGRIVLAGLSHGETPAEL